MYYLEALWLIVTSYNLLYDHFICLGEVFYQFGGRFEPPTSPDICTKMTFSYLVDTNYLMFSHIIPIGPHKVQETGEKMILLKFQGFKNY